MAYSTGKIAVVTGAGSGIGRALARQLNQEGCDLYLSDVDEAKLAETADLLECREAAVDTRVLDVADKHAVHSWARDIDGWRGRADIVVNNAGVAYVATAAESDYEHLEWLININLWGVIYGTMAFLPLLQQSAQGHLVNISSVFGIIAVPTQSAYNAAKFGVRGFTEAVRHEMAGSNVHVCCVHPGGIRTNIARDSRGGDPSVSREEREQLFEQLARTTPESAAAQIVRAIERRKKRLLIGQDARYISLISRLFPVNYLRFVPGAGEIRQHLNRPD
jgi:NADP-dependent 3-hydroxy acid dehydrogenase YdfG